ncbi:zinc-binding dehydrogenase [Okeania sp. SIO2B3]|uniref:zinc-binding dehydrogenase n=1 Tax=Okeania sp. SIO2B3 TaxID=2607784 RepID=UPI0025FAE26E|nr:zinc-binding dehydrogenase [Okeania sp. SIO2B3]
MWWYYCVFWFTFCWNDFWTRNRYIVVGGLDHIAVQFASKLGNRVTVFTTSEGKAKFASELGADEAIVTKKGEDPSAPSRQLNILLSTVSISLNWSAYVEFLDSDGTLAFVGVPDAPLTLFVFQLLMKRRRIIGFPIGGRAIMNEMLSVAAQYKIEPIVEVFSFDRANEAMQKVKDN